MTKRQAVESIEDWGPIVDEVINIMHLYTRTLQDRIEMGKRLIYRLQEQKDLSRSEFHIIWNMRIERVNRMIIVLKECLDMEIVEVLL